MWEARSNSSVLFFCFVPVCLPSLIMYALLVSKVFCEHESAFEGEWVMFVSRAWLSQLNSMWGHWSRGAAEGLCVQSEFCGVSNQNTLFLTDEITDFTLRPWGRLEQSISSMLYCCSVTIWCFEPYFYFHMEIIYSPLHLSDSFSDSLLWISRQ